MNGAMEKIRSMPWLHNCRLALIGLSLATLVLSCDRREDQQTTLQDPGSTGPSNKFAPPKHTKGSVETFRHSFSSALPGETDKLREEFRQFREQSNESIREVLRSILTGAGRDTYQLSGKLVKVLSESERSDFLAVANEIDGAGRAEALSAYRHVFSEEGNAQALAEGYQAVDPGTLRTDFASSLVSATLAADGISAASDQIAALDFPEERRNALKDMIGQLRSTGVDGIDPEAAKRLREVAQDQSYGKALDTLLPGLPK